MLPCVDSLAVISCHSSSPHLNSTDRPRKAWVLLWALTSHLSVSMQSHVHFPSLHPQPCKPILILPSGFPFSFMKKPSQKAQSPDFDPHWPFPVDIGAAWLAEPIGHQLRPLCTWAAKHGWAESEMQLQDESLFREWTLHS